MKYLPLVWAGLMRKPARSAFTLLSVMVAFLLFGMLQGINVGFDAVIDQQQLDRLLTDPRVPGGAPMPVSAVARIKQVPGVTRVCGRGQFFGFYQDPKNGVYALATDAADWLGVRPEFKMPAADLAKLQSTRAGIVMSPGMRDRLKLKIGDPVPVRSPIPRKDGNPVWTFELVGTFELPDNPRLDMALVNYVYFDEARAKDIGTVDRIIVRIADPSRSAQTAAAIDKLFANSAHETRTQNEKESTERSIQQLGDIGFFTNAIVGAVFFALLFVTGNTMVQSVRERIPEFAVLRTIGFPGGGILALVIGEAALLCMLAAVLGLALAAVLFPRIQQVTGLRTLSWWVVFVGMGFALLLSMVSALLPGLRVLRLRIVDALAVR